MPFGVNALPDDAIDHAAADGACPSITWHDEVPRRVAINAIWYPMQPVLPECSGVVAVSHPNDRAIYTQTPARTRR